MRAELPARALALAAVALASLIVAGCEEPPPSPPPPPSVPAPEPTPEPEPAPEEPSCVAPSALWFEEADGDTSLALSLGDRGGLVARGRGADITTRALDAEGRVGAAPVELRVEGAASLFALEPVADGYVLLARGACRESAHCFFAQRLGGDGAASGEAISVALPGPLVTSRRVATEERLYVAWSTAGGHRGLDIYLADGGLGRARAALGPEPASDELPTEILGLAATGDRWAVLWRRGAGEDERSAVHLTTDHGHRTIAALHEALTVEAMERSADQVRLVTGFEMSRPHFLRIAVDADEPTVARELAAGEGAPAPFEDRLRASLDVDAEGLLLRWRDGAGDGVGEPVRVTEGEVRSATVARREAAALVAWVAGGAVHASWVRCPDPS